MPSFAGAAIRVYNAWQRHMRPFSKPPSRSPELREIDERAMRLREDIGDHLSTLFSETLVMRPRLIVELGVRQGASRFALEQAARLCGSALVSSDLDDCSAVCSQSPRWYFVKQDDIAFAGEFPEWCAARNIAPGIDVLFIDTSHLYEHTVQEIRAWFPLLSSCCKVIFHDTNLRKYFRRLDGTIGGGWDNERGVIRAIEERLDTKFNERIDFVTTVDEWTIRHWAHCNGLTVLERDHGFSRLSTPRS